MNHAFRVGVTRDFLKPDGTLGFGDIGLELLERAGGVQWQFLEEDAAELRGEMIRGYDGLLVLAPRVSARSLEGADRLKIIARFGVGYDTIDVPACTRAGVLLTITPAGVRRPMATATIALLLALSHKLVIKDRLTRAGRWAERMNHMGAGLAGRTLGVVGVGNIGRAVLELAAPFQMRHLGCDPCVARETLASAQVELVELETLLGEADFVVLCCALTSDTRHLINASRIQLMKPTACLINVARGPVVDQQALTEALQQRRIQGAALDVFEREPIDPHDPLLALDNVIVSPHSLCWTDEMFLGVGREACQSILDVAAGRAPSRVVNGELLSQPQLRARLTDRG